MREILFRGKRIDNGEWAEGYYLVAAGMAFISAFGIREPIHVDGETVGQYTGLTDKNGKQIFEGDIVRHHNDNPYAIPTIVEKGKVYWDEGRCGWQRTSNGAFNHGVIDTYRMSHECVYEVIGNIHDNPELLKEAET